MVWHGDTKVTDPNKAFSVFTRDIKKNPTFDQQM